MGGRTRPVVRAGLSPLACSINRTIAAQLPRRRTPGQILPFVAAVLIALVWVQGVAASSTTSNAIVTENQQPGSPNWFSHNISLNHEIEGYADHVSASAGDVVHLFVSTQYSTYHVLLYRLGYYGGVGARLMADLGYFAGARQPTPAPDPTTGLVECHWTAQASVPISSDWVTGLYLFRLDGQNGLTSYIPLVVKGSPSAAILFQASTTTYAAYNDWGGESLYVSQTGYPSRSHAYVVSFDRPYSSFDDSDAPGSGQELVWEYPLAYWLEKSGNDVSYTTDNETHASPATLLQHQVFVVAGHDEYWSKAMRSGIIAARDQGTHIMFLGANVGFRHIRFDSSPLGVNRRVICYKQDSYTKDPLYGVDNSDVTIEWSSKFTDKPENSILGIMDEAMVFQQGGYAPYYWRNSDSEFGDVPPVTPTTAPLITGVEYDCQYDNQLTPSNEEILTASPLINSHGVPGESETVRYRAPSGAFVFSAGTFALSWGLDDVRTRISGVTNQSSETVRGMLTHVLNDMVYPAVPPSGTLSPAPVGIRVWPSNVQLEPGGSFWLRAAVIDHHESSRLTWQIPNAPAWASVSSAGWVSLASNAPDGGTFQVSCQSPNLPGAVAYATVTVQALHRSTCRFLAGMPSPGYHDGAAASAQFGDPVGLTSDGNGVVYVADSDTNSIRVIANGQVSTLAGGSSASSPTFQTPTGIAFVGDSLLVSDTYHNLIRRVSLSGAVSTFAGNGTAGLRDGTAASAEFNMPTGIALDPSGNVYIADSGNHSIRKIAPDGTVSTVAGTGKPGFIDGPIGQSQLYFPYGLSWSSDSNLPGLIIADSGNYSLRCLAPSGSLTTVAGNGLRGYRDGPANQAQFDLPVGVAALPSGGILITDERNSVVRLFDPRVGVVRTLLGQGANGTRAGFDRTCQFNVPVGLCLDKPGQLYVSDATRVYQVSLNFVPLTALSVSAPGGAGGWYTGSATAALNAIAPVRATAIAATYYQVDGGATSTYSSAFSVPSEGNHQITFWSVDNAGDTEPAQSASFGIDSTPPVTAASLSGVQGSNSYYRGPVSITLNASDALSGVAVTYYQVDGWAVQRYSSPFSVSSDGNRTVTYWSVDGAGNVESQHVLHFAIDQTAPTITVVASPNRLTANSGFVSVTISGSMTDAASGVDPSTASYHVVDSLGRVQPAGPISLASDGSFAFTVSLDTAAPSGTRVYNFWLSALDHAGNTRQQQLQVSTG